jgi:glycosyltransferase involved in cell wall biosynthesis
MKKVKVSVIVPVFDVEKYIALTVKSVLAQTYSDFELLIIDDASPDNSFDICRSFIDPRIKIIRQSNAGVGSARNTGIRHAQGEYIAFLDGDDIWLPEKLEKHILHLDHSPQVGLSFCRSAFIDENGSPLNLYQIPKLTDISIQHILCRNPIGNASTPVIRREVLDEIRYEDYSCGSAQAAYFESDKAMGGSADIECWLRISIKTQWILEGIPEVLTLYRLNSVGLSANMTKQLESWEKVIEKTRQYAPEIINRWESLARAYQLRYLGRRAVRMRDGRTAIHYVSSALATDWRILVEEPQRTILTLTAAYILWLFPKSFYYQIENIALKITGKFHRLKIRKDERRGISKLTERLPL